MTVVKFEGLPWPQKGRHWAENLYVTHQCIGHSYKQLKCCFGVFVPRKKFENLSQKFPIWADFLSFCFNDCSKVRKLALATKMKTLSWKFIFSLFLGINKFITVLANLLTEKSLKTLLELSCPPLRRPWIFPLYFMWCHYDLSAFGFMAFGISIKRGTIHSPISFGGNDVEPFLFFLLFYSFLYVSAFDCLYFP